MRKAETTNVFTDGLVMDFNPLVSPSNTLCNALNATLITRNGNENALQNDMGNGRVETACLPEGYIPLGTASLGGIIYIVSYNPLTNKCQIGSFPSPERNITTDEISSTQKVLSSIKDFQFTEEEGAKSTYVKKIFTELKFNPGDLFIVYGNSIKNNINKLFPVDDEQLNLERLKTQAVKISIGALSDNGKLIIFDDLKKYTILTEDPDGDKEELYHIAEYSEESNEAPFEVSRYRNLLSQPYNVFKSKISGKIILVCELVQPNDFDVSVQHIITEEGNQSKYRPELQGTLTSDYPIAPKGIYCKATLEIKDSESKTTVTYIDFDYDKSSNITLQAPYTQYEFNIQSIVGESIAQELDKFNFASTQMGNAEGTLTLEIVPYMNWGLVKYLTKSITIDLSKINTGFVNLVEWRYYNQDSNITLNWGLECYEKQNETISEVSMTFFYLEGGTVQQHLYSTPKQESYHGKFIEKFNKEEGDSELQNILKPNTLYLTKIEVKFNSEKSPKKFYRWLYTSPVFNDSYNSVDDFNTLYLPIEFNVSSQLTPLINKQQEEISHGQYFCVAEDPVQDVDTLSYIKNNYRISGTMQAQINLQNDYNIFGLSYDNDTFDISLQDLTATVENTINGNNVDSDLYLGASIGNVDTGISINLKGFSFKNGIFTLNYNSATYTGTYYYINGVLRLFQLPFWINLSSPSTTVTINSNTATIGLQQGTLTLVGTNSQETYSTKVLNPSYVITSMPSIQNSEFAANIKSFTFNMQLDEYVKAYCDVIMQKITYDLVYRPLVSVNNYLEKGFYVDTEQNKIYFRNVIAFSSGRDGPFSVYYCDYNHDSRQYSTKRYNLTDADDASYGFLDNANNYRTTMLQHNIPDITLFVHVLHHDELYKWEKGARVSYGLNCHTSDLFPNWDTIGDYKVFLGIKAPTGEPVPICYTCNFRQKAWHKNLDEGLYEEMSTTEFQTFIKNIFCALNQIYYQDTTSISENYYTANNITFIDNQSINVSIPIKAQITKEPILLINGEKLTDVATSLINSVQDGDINLNNTKYTFSTGSYTSTVSFSISNDSDGRSLRNTMLNVSVSNYAIYNLDGQTINRNASFTGNPGSTKLYMITENDQLSNNWQFYPQRISYDFNSRKAKMLARDYLVDVSLSTPNKLNDYFSIKDGSIYITNPTNEYRFSFTQKKGNNRLSGLQLKYIGRSYLDCREPLVGESGIVALPFRRNGFDSYEYSLDEESEHEGYITNSFLKNGVDVFFNLTDNE